MAPVELAAQIDKKITKITAPDGEVVVLKTPIGEAAASSKKEPGILSSGVAVETKFPLDTDWQKTGSLQSGRTKRYFTKVDGQTVIIEISAKYIVEEGEVKPRKLDFN